MKQLDAAKLAAGTNIMIRDSLQIILLTLLVVVSAPSNATPPAPENTSNVFSVSSESHSSWNQLAGRKGGSRNSGSTYTPSSSGASSGCGSKRTCGQMSSCSEARSYMSQCGATYLDRNNDGIPCESLCK